MHNLAMVITLNIADFSTKPLTYIHESFDEKKQTLRSGCASSSPNIWAIGVNCSKQVRIPLKKIDASASFASDIQSKAAKFDQIV